jgi:hypothetical protein
VAQWGSRGIGPLFNPGARSGGWLTPLPDCFTPGKETRYPSHRRLDGPQDRSGRVRNISPSPAFDPRNVNPVTSRYTDWDIPAPLKSGYYGGICWKARKKPYKTLSILHVHQNCYQLSQSARRKVLQTNAVKLANVLIAKKVHEVLVSFARVVPQSMCPCGGLLLRVTGPLKIKTVPNKHSIVKQLPRQLIHSLINSYNIYFISVESTQSWGQTSQAHVC